MATHDYVIDNSTGANVRADINNVLQAILTNNSSSSAPSTTAAYMFWADTTSGTLKIRNSSNNAWVELLQLDGTLTLEDGSASTPGLAFRDDLNTGIFSSAADTFNVATGGVERMELGATTIFNESGADVDFRIEGDTNQNLFYVNAGNNRVGIGTSSPNSLLDVSALGASDEPTFKVSSENSTIFLRTAGSSGSFPTGGGGNDGELLYFGGDFRLGIGTASKNLIFFNGSAYQERMRIDSSGRLLIGLTSSATTDSNAHSRLQAVTTAGPSVFFGRDDSDTADNSRLGVINFGSNHGGTFHEVVTIRAAADAQHASNSKASRLELYTTGTGTTSSTERMRIDSIGNMGLGVTPNSNWPSNGDSRAFQIGTGACIFGRGSGDEDRGGIAVNFYATTSGNFFLANGHAARVYMNDGRIDFQNTTAANSSGANTALTFATPMSIIPDGNIGIGTTAPTAPLHVVNSASSTDAIISNSGNDSRLHIIAGTNQKNSIIRFGDPDDDNRGAIDYDHNGDSLSFRIAGTADVLLFNSLGAATFNAASPSTNAFLMDNRSSTNPEGLYLRFSFASPNTQNRHFLKCTDSTSDRAVIDSNGNSRNINNSYAGFSDISLKENIVDASSQWDDIKNLKVRVFNFKIDSPIDKRIGVVAQEIETVCPKLVEEVFDKDSDGNLLETSTKSVKYSILYMKAVKCLQEAITKIEVLETKVAALEAA